MTTEEPSILGPFELADPEVAGALAALRRARRRAEEIAAATGTALVLQIDGKVVRVYPQASGANRTGT